MPKKDTTDTATEPAGLVALRQRIADMERDAAAARDEEAKLAAEAERLKDEARGRHASREKLEREIARAEREALDIERAQPAPPIDRATAVELAESLLTAFDDTNGADGSATEEQRAASLWRVIDDCRCRLLTPEVAEDARPLVLSIDGAIEAVDAWESFRRPEAAGAKGADGEELPDLRWQSMPLSDEPPAVARAVPNLILARGDDCAAAGPPNLTTHQSPPWSRSSTPPPSRQVFRITPVRNWRRTGTLPKAGVSRRSNLNRRRAY